MRGLLAYGMCFFLGIACVRAERIDASLAAAYSKTRGETALLIWKDGKIIYERAAEASGLAPRIYSITKSLVSIGVFRDVKAGGLSLGQKIENGAGRGIVLADLMNQTSGLPSAGDAFYTVGLENKEKVLRKLVRNGDGGVFVYGPSHWEVLAEEIRRKWSGVLDGWIGKFVPGAKRAIMQRWRRDERGVVFFSTGARMNARELLPAGNEVLRGMRGGWSNEVREALQQGSPGNRMYALGFWLNRGAKSGAKEIDIEGSIGKTHSASYWANGCLSRTAPADLLAMVGTRGQRVYVVPSKRMIVIRQGMGTGFSDAEFLRKLFGT